MAFSPITLPPTSILSFATENHEEVIQLDVQLGVPARLAVQHKSAVSLAFDNLPVGGPGPSHFRDEDAVERLEIRRRSTTWRRFGSFEPAKAHPEATNHPNGRDCQRSHPTAVSDHCLPKSFVASVMMAASICVVANPTAAIPTPPTILPSLNIGTPPGDVVIS